MSRLCSFRSRGSYRASSNRAGDEAGEHYPGVKENEKIFDVLKGLDLIYDKQYIRIGKAYEINGFSTVSFRRLSYEKENCELHDKSL